MPSARPAFVRFRSALAGLALTGGALIAVVVAATPAQAVIPSPTAPACTSTLATGISLAQDTPTSSARPNARLTATDNRGLWAGVRYDGFNTFQVISWRAGQTTVLGTYFYPSVFNEQYTVSVVGISTADAIIVDAWDPPTHRMRTYSYSHGVRTTMAHNSDWMTWTATGVSPDGHISGMVETNHTDVIVEWDSHNRLTTIASGQVSRPFIDQYDDMMWSEWHQPVLGPSEQLTHFRTPTGHIGQLVNATNSDANIDFVAGRWIWARDIYGALVIWDMSQARAASELSPILERRQNAAEIIAGSPSRAYVAADDRNPSMPSTYVVYDVYGDARPAPAQYRYAGVEIPNFGIASYGPIAYSGIDGRVRFYSCPLNYAAHNPRGMLYGPTTSGGQTTLTGGAFDADNRGARINVDIYENGHFKSRLLANQTDDWFAREYALTGGYRYRTTFPTAPGTHTYCAYGLNIGYGNANTKLGCTTVTG